MKPDRLHPLVFAGLVVATALVLACSGDREAAGGPSPEATPPAAQAEAPPDPPDPEEPPTTAGSDDPGPESGASEDVEEPEGPEGNEPSEGADAAGDAEEPGDAQASTRSAPPDPRPSRDRTRTADGVRVYTNDDLKRYRRLSPASGGEGDEDSLARRAPDEEGQGGEDVESGEGAGDAHTPEDRAERLESTLGEIARLEEELRHLRDRIPSMRNPYLPRVAPLDEDREAEAGMDNVERIRHVEGRIAEVEQLLEKAMARLPDPDGGTGAREQ